VDPLIRNLNRNKDIEGILSHFKVCAYADDISIICRENKKSIQSIFTEYQKLTNISGLELNADKTEILRLTTDSQISFSVTYKMKAIVLLM
jgi:hypothetical protein